MKRSRLAGSAVSEFVVIDSSGNVDMNASLSLFEQKLQEHVETRGVLTRSIAQAVHAVFDEYQGCNFNTPALVSFVMRRFPESLVKDNYDILEQAINDYVHNSPEFLVQRKTGIKRLSDTK